MASHAGAYASFTRKNCVCVHWRHPVIDFAIFVLADSTSFDTFAATTETTSASVLQGALSSQAAHPMHVCLRILTAADFFQVS